MNELRTAQLATSRLMLVAILAVTALHAGLTAVLFQAPQLVGQKKVLTDFDAFHIAGAMAAQGHADATYQASEMIAAQRAITGTTSFMPWSYPPPYTLAMEGLAYLPIGTAYLLFIVASFLFYLAVLRRISGAYLPGVLIAIAPTILLMIRSGQSGFLTAGLIGTFLLTIQNRQKVAGISLGLMCIKPHLTIGIALLALFQRRWQSIAMAMVVAGSAMVVTTAVFGTSIWSAFFGGMREASHFLAAGYYPLFRMSSIYAFVKSLGGSASLALVLHVIIAILCIAFMQRMWRSGCSWNIMAAITCAASLFVSPYNYDYDLATLGIAIAFVLPEVIARSRLYERIALLGLTWISTSYGLASSFFLENSSQTAVSALGEGHWPSLIAPALLLLAFWAIALLRREPDLITCSTVGRASGSGADRFSDGR